MASSKQVAAARRNIRKAASGAKRKRTLAHLPMSKKRALGREGAKARRASRS